MQDHDNQPIETLRLSDKDKNKLLHHVEQLSTRPVASSRRSLRVRFNTGGVLVTLMQPNGAVSRLSVLPRNLSKRGIAFIHGRFIYPGMLTDVTLPTLDGELIQVHGKVRNCRHISGIVHEVSIVFTSVIDIEMFVELNADQKSTYRQECAHEPGHESVTAAEPVGPSALIVDDSSTDRRLYAMWLRKLGLDATEAETGSETSRLVKSHAYDAMLVDINLENENGKDVIRNVRDLGFHAPIVAISADGSDRCQSDALEAGGNAFLVKPFSREDLEQAFRQIAVVSNTSGEDAPIFSSINGDPEMRPLLQDFVSSLSRQTQKLRDAMHQADMNTLRDISRLLKGSGGSYGFNTVTDNANDLLIGLEARDDMDDQLRQQVTELIALLRRVKV